MSAGFGEGMLSRKSRNLAGGGRGTGIQHSPRSPEGSGALERNSTMKAHRQALARSYRTWHLARAPVLDDDGDSVRRRYSVAEISSTEATSSMRSTT